MEDLFDFRALRIRQPGKLLPDRASYEILTDGRELIAVATDPAAARSISIATDGGPLQISPASKG